jgi:hypothetical protein
MLAICSAPSCYLFLSKEKETRDFPCRGIYYIYGANKVILTTRQDETEYICEMKEGIEGHKMKYIYLKLQWVLLTP